MYSSVAETEYSSPLLIKILVLSTLLIAVKLLNFFMENISDSYIKLWHDVATFYALYCINQLILIILFLYSFNVSYH